VHFFIKIAVTNEVGDAGPGLILGLWA
jgi:hypothetical protein